MNRESRRVGTRISANQKSKEAKPRYFTARRILLRQGFAGRGARNQRGNKDPVSHEGTKPRRETRQRSEEPLSHAIPTSRDHDRNEKQRSKETVSHGTTHPASPRLRRTRRSPRKPKQRSEEAVSRGSCFAQGYAGQVHADKRRSERNPKERGKSGHRPAPGRRP